MNEKYDKIIASALKLFTREGFQNTPTALIAKEAGVANGTLFHYFKNKEVLIDSVYLHSKESLIEALKAGINQGMNIPEIAGKMFLNGIKWSIENTEHLIFYQIYGHTHFISYTTKDDGHKKFAFLLELIEEGKKLGYIKDIPSDLVYTAVIGIMVQMMNYYSEHPEEFNDKQSLTNAFTLLWDSIKK